MHQQLSKHPQHHYHHEIEMNEDEFFLSSMPDSQIDFKSPLFPLKISMQNHVSTTRPRGRTNRHLNSLCGREKFQPHSSKRSGRLTWEMHSQTGASNEPP